MHDLLPWLDALLDDRPLPAPPADPELAVRLDALARRLQARQARVDVLERGLERVHATLLGFAAQDFAPTLDLDGEEPTIDATFIALNMLGEEIAHAHGLLERARDEAISANRTKTTFLANMSHELRTPLNAIIGYTEIIQDEARDAAWGAQIAPDIARVLGAAHHLVRLISDILDLSKIEAGHMQFDLQDLDPGALLRETCAVLRRDAEAGHLTIGVFPSARRRVRADRLRVMQVLLNLVSNAVKFAAHPQDGRGAAEITLRTWDDGGMVVLSVEDTGPGIHPGVLPTLFTPFVQGAPTSGRGTGLGLSIARELCRGMAGDISVRSVFGRGSTFEVRLPAGSPLHLSETSASDGVAVTTPG